ncbi:hypothetical protein BDW42DRAFT_181592 [Aspergillus taichungensis]|uniref:Uncharacterized protein n=1 Tax=Aspergillus taichungensis TaxID=482145 RepID=A0A2J5HDJ3_9EURO|nr:hypothetical protein BDW42DRAFT_181592 [Aspergillus taichungensis]
MRSRHGRQGELLAGQTGVFLSDDCDFGGIPCRASVDSSDHALVLAVCLTRSRLADKSPTHSSTDTRELPVIFFFLITFIMIIISAVIRPFCPATFTFLI